MAFFAERKSKRETGHRRREGKTRNGARGLVLEPAPGGRGSVGESSRFLGFANEFVGVAGR